MDKDKKTFTLEDFEKGLMLAGYLSPISEIEIAERELVKKQVNENRKRRGEIYFKRSVLAAEIVNQLKDEFTFGRIKFQKLVYLCEHVSNMGLENRYLKFAAGPFDNKFMHSIDKEFSNQKWFIKKTITSGGYRKPKYEAGEKIEQYKKYYQGYFGEYDSSIQEIINLFRFKKTDFVELIATLYHCQLELIKSKKSLKNDLIIKCFYSWAKEKERFSEEEILEGLVWMNEKGIYPT